MAKITLGGNPIETRGELPKVGEKVADFTLAKVDLSRASLADFAGKKIVFNIFPSVDTGVCAASVRYFNEKAAAMDNTVVLCISRDLPFAQQRFCGAEGIENVVMLSDFEDGSFGKDYALDINDGIFKGLHSRVIIITDENGVIKYTEQVPEIGQAPDFDSALAHL